MKKPALTISCTNSFKQQLAKIRRAGKRPSTIVFVITSDDLEYFASGGGVHLIHTYNPVTIKQQLAEARKLVADGFNVVFIIDNLDEMLANWIKQIQNEKETDQGPGNQAN